MNTFAQIIHIWIRAVSLALFLGLGLVGAGCASGSRLVDHAFAFDVRADSPDVELLNYRYGTSSHPGARPPDWALRQGWIGQQAGVSGPMILGDTLYVKWRIRSSGEELEETVDLKTNLPNDITDHKVYFVIQGRDIYVYLISPELRSRDSPRIGPKVYRDYYKIYQIYPTSTLSK